MTENNNDYIDTPPNNPIFFSSSEQHIRTIFDDGDWVEFRALRDKSSSSGKVHTLYRQAPIREDDTSLDEWLTAHNAKGWSLYIGANPRKSNRCSGACNAATDSDVEKFNTLFVDFDDADPEEAMLRIESASLPEPTLLVASGRATGTHAYWRFDEPITDPVLWRSLQITMIRSVQSDKAIKNPSRIMRLCGTENHKRGAPCRILKIGGTFPKWDDLGIEPAQEVQSFQTQHDPDRTPCTENLNTVTLSYLQEETEGGERNNKLVAAAFDYNANNYPIEQAIKELAIERGVNRDGLSESESVRTVQNAYKKKATPSFTRTLVEETTASDLLSDLNESKGMAPEGFTPDNASTAVAVKIAEDDNSSPPVSDNTAHVSDKKEVVRVDNRPVDPSDRVLVSNVSTKVVMENGRRKVVTLYKPVDEIASEMSEALGGYPRRSTSTGVFAIKETKKEKVELWSILDTNDLFALFHDRAIVRWVRGECETLQGDTLSAITKTEFFRWVKDNMEPSYEGVSEYPHVPPRPSTFYLPTVLPEPTGKCLDEFVAALNPATENDRKLMMAAMMTPGWGGASGARPMFVFTSDYGQGSGKTETAKAIGRIWGGSATLDYEDNWQNISKRIMSSDDWLSRIFLFDNIKGKFSGSAIEAAVTSEYLTGHKMFVGTVKRPNDATFMLTFNLPEMSRDLAQRSVIVKVGKPSAGDFVEWACQFVEEHRLQLISDILHLLKQTPEKVVSMQHADRWRAWQRDVLSKVPDCDVDALAAEIIERRPGADADAEEASSIVQAISDHLILYARREDSEEITEVTGAEIVKVMEVSGNWRANDTFSASSNSRKCMSIVKGKLLGRGVLMPIETEGKDGQKRPKKVRVNDEGRPCGERSPTQSIVFGWVWEKAEEVLGTFSSQEDLENALTDDLPI